MEVKYYIDGVDLKTYGVSVSGSEGLLSRPKIKAPVSMSWEGYHGDVIDVSKRRYESRQISIDCFIVANDNIDLIAKFNAFAAVFDKTGLRQLLVSVEPAEPLAYMVLLEESIDIKKIWGETQVVGTFTLNLREPEPVKKVLRYTRSDVASKTVSITVTSAKMLNIYWGDGTFTYDVSGTAVTVTHDYAVNGRFYIVVTGNIEEITSLTSTGAIVWNKL